MNFDESTPEKVPVKPGNARLERSGDNGNPADRGIGTPLTSTETDKALSKEAVSSSGKSLSWGSLPDDSVKTDDELEGNARLERSGDNGNPADRGIGAPLTSTNSSESVKVETHEWDNQLNSEKLNTHKSSEGLFVVPEKAESQSSGDLIEPRKDEAEISVEPQAVDRPFRSLFKQVLLVGSIAVLLLTAVGVFMGLTGLKTPHISGDAVVKQLQRALGQDTAYDDWNELEKNDR